MRSTEISNSDDIIDSRDVIKRIADLESELTDACDSEGNGVPFDEWVKAMAENDSGALQEGAAEFLALKSLEEECEGYASDWRHGATLIRESHFTKYAEELAIDIGAIGRGEAWPLNFINWDEAAEELKQDYTEVDFDGVAYCIR